jgi:oxygen-independent coproporphyrinogen III oxidase
MLLHRRWLRSQQANPRRFASWRRGLRATILFMTASRDDALGVYISIPFCRSKCTYCNFASGVYPASEQARYVDRVVQDLAASLAWAERVGVKLPRRVDTVYLGGGTPSLLKPELVSRLFVALRAVFALEPDAEITVECAPGQLASETLQTLVAAGVNRVSLGVQSFIDRETALIGRRHRRVESLAEIERLRAAGIANLSVDLIAGLPGQTSATWEESLAVLAGSGVPHASIYMLEVDQDSRLGREVLAHGTRFHANLVPSDDAVAQMYSVAIERLRQAGLEQYEISNFCRPGMASRHNLRYWQRRPYLGLGLDASSMLLGAPGPDFRTWEGSVLRSTTTDDMKAFLAGAELTEKSWLTPAQQHEEAWFLGLRLNAGVEVAALQREFGPAMVAPALRAVAGQVEAGLVVFDGRIVRLTARGQLLSNEVFQEFLGLEADQ